MLFYGISLIMKEKSNASALEHLYNVIYSRPRVARIAAASSTNGGRE